MRFLGAYCLLLALLIAVQGAHAHENARDTFLQNSIHAGSFMLTPKLTLEQSYNTNIYAQNTSEKDDFVTKITPSLQIDKFIRDHAFLFVLKSEIKRHATLNQENLENYYADFNANVVGTRRLKFPVHASYYIDHRERQSQRATQRTREPLKFKTLNFNTGVEYSLNRMTIGIYGDFRDQDNDNGISQTGGTPVIRSDSDHQRYGGTLKVGYDTKRNWAPFALLRIAVSDYERRSYTGGGFTGLSRDNTVIGTQAGLNFNYKGLLKGGFSLGHEWRDYDDASAEDITAFTADADVKWQANEGTSLLFRLSRRTEEDNDLNNGFVETRALLGLDYELKQDLFLTGHANYENADFERTSRNDDYYSFGLGLDYIINPRLSVGGEIMQNIRVSTDNQAEFDQTVFMLRLTGGL